MTATAVVVLSRRLGAVLPASAVPLLNGRTLLLVDSDIPTELAEQFSAIPIDDADHRLPDQKLPDQKLPDQKLPDQKLLLTLDPGTGAAARWVTAGAIVLNTPEPPGVRLLEAVAVMDQLRSPGGCPWDAAQTHRSLLPYLIEETYELYQAVEDGDATAVREELGDVLLQVLFHARVAQEQPAGFDVDAVADQLVTKLIGRHPHVFADGERVHTAADQQIRWEQLKRAEKRRESSVDGVPLAQPALALAAKLVSRTARAGVPDDLLPKADGGAGEALFALAAATKLAGQDPEAALRTVARRFAEDLRSAERAAQASGLDPHLLTAGQWREHWPTMRTPAGE